MGRNGATNEEGHGEGGLEGCAHSRSSRWVMVLGDGNAGGLRSRDSYTKPLESVDGALSTYFTGGLGFTLCFQSLVFRHVQML